jgi:hypothetical protein
MLQHASSFTTTPSDTLPSGESNMNMTLASADLRRLLDGSLSSKRRRRRREV